MEAEHLDGADQRIESALRQYFASVREERTADRPQLSEQFGRRCVGCELVVWHARTHIAGQTASSRRESCIDADQCLTVWLVLTVRVGVARHGSKRQQLIGGMHQPCRERKLRTETMRLLQIVREFNGGVGADGVGERVSDEVRGAV